jgi:hypothetical protein
MKMYKVYMRMENGKIISVVVSGWSRGDASLNAKKMYPTYSLTGRVEEL